MSKNKFHFYVFMMVVVVSVSSCSSSLGGLSGASGTRGSQRNETKELGAAKSIKTQKEPGHDPLSGTVDKLPNTPPSSPVQPVQNPSAVDVGINFQQWRGDASFTNCVDIAVNGGKSIRLGCNKDGNLSKVIKVSALSRPSLNVIRIIFTTQGKEQSTTEDGSSNKLMRVSKSGNSFRIGYEDASDGDFNDFIFTISVDSGIAMGIENCKNRECSLE